MKKIPTLFIRRDHELIDEPHTECLWVLKGEGVATRKFDGSCCWLDAHNKLWKRREVEKGRIVPPEIIIVDADNTTGKIFGWVPVDPHAKEDQWFREGRANLLFAKLDQTYELCGPKVNGNPEELTTHELIMHGGWEIWGMPTDFWGLKKYLRELRFEGIVWHHPDGRMAKIKRKDFWK